MYSYDQSDLLAGGLQWSPRPVIQSYAAFSPSLADLNRQHLTGSQAPEWVVFAPQPIDGRFPSVEDGPSWLELLRRYEPSSFAGHMVVLHRRHLGPLGPEPGPAIDVEAKLGERVPVASGTELTFVSFDIGPTLVGSSALMFYKTEPLRLTVQTADAVERAYRLPLGMARAGFLVSPITASAREFASLYEGSTAYGVPARTVVAIRVDSSDLLWEASYRFTVSTVQSPTR